MQNDAMSSQKSENLVTKIEHKGIESEPYWSQTEPTGHAKVAQGESEKAKKEPNGDQFKIVRNASQKGHRINEEMHQFGEPASINNRCKKQCEN